MLPVVYEHLDAGDHLVHDVFDDNHVWRDRHPPRSSTAGSPSRRPDRRRHHVHA
jgi:hypothetical protein